MFAAPALALPGTAPTVTVNTGGAAPTFTTVSSTQLDVTLNASRTLMQYGGPGYAVNSGETVRYLFGNRADLAIVHNLGSGPLTLNGTVQALVGSQFGGNLWFLSPTGIIIGSNAIIDVGGLLASTSLPRNLTDLQLGPLNPQNLAIQFDPSNFGTVTVQTGAQVTGHGGTLAFISREVKTQTGSTITGVGGTSVLYGASEGFTIRFAQTASNDLDLLDFEIKTATNGVDTSGNPLDLGGVTQVTGGNIYAAAVSRSTVFQSVINAPGLLSATKAANVGGDIVLSAGSGIVAKAPEAPLRNAFYRFGMQAGSINAGGDVRLQATGNITVSSTLFAGGSLFARGVNITIAGIDANADIFVHAGDPMGSSLPPGGYGYGQPYGPQGGSAQFTGPVSTGDDFIASAWNGDVRTRSVTLTALGADIGRDPGGMDDMTGDGRRLIFLTTGNNPGSIYLGTPGSPVDSLRGGTQLDLNSARDATVTILGDARLSNIVAAGDIRVSAGFDSTGPDGNGRFIVDTVKATGNVDITTDGDVIAGDLDPSLARGHVLTVNSGGGISFVTAEANAIFMTAANGIDGGGLAATSVANLHATGGDVDLHAALLTPQSVDDGRLLLTADDGDVHFGLGNGSLTGALFSSFTAFTGSVFVDVPGTIAIDRITAGRHAEISGGSAHVVELNVGGVDDTAQDALVTARTGDARVDFATVIGDLTIAAPNGLAFADTVLTNGSFRLTGNTVFLNFIDAISDSRSPFDITILAATGDFSFVDYLVAEHDLTVDIGGTLSLRSAYAGNDMRLTGRTALNLSTDYGTGYGYGFGAGNDIFLTAPSISIADGTGLQPGRDLILVATAGAVTLADSAIDPGRDLIVSATSDATLGTVYAGRDITVDAGGSITGDTIAANRNTTLRGASVGVDGAFGDTGSVFIRAATGDAVAGGGAAALDLTILAPNGLASIGNAQAGRDFTLRGAQASLESLGGFNPGGYGSPTGPRDAVIATTAGDFSYSGTLAVTRDINIDIVGNSAVAGTLAGNDLFFRATGDLAMTGPMASSAGRDAVFDGGTVQLAGFAAGRDLTATARSGLLIATAALTAGDDVLLAGNSVTILSATATGMGADSETAEPLLGSNVAISGGALIAILLDGARDATINMTGDANIFAVNAGRDAVLTAGTLSPGSVTAGRDGRFTATAAGLALGGETSIGRDLFADAAGVLTLTGGQSAVRDLSLIGASIAGSGRNASAGRDLTATARSGGTLVLGNATAGDDVLLMGPSITVDTARATGAGADSESVEPLLGSNVNIFGGSLNAKKLIAARDVIVTMTGNATIDPGGGYGLAVDAGRDAILTGGSLNLGQVQATRDALLRTTASNLVIGSSISAGRDLGGDASGTLSYNGLSAMRDLALFGASVSGSGTATAGRDINITARAGTVGVTSLTAGDDVRLQATGAITATGTVKATGAGADSEGDGFNVVAGGAAVNLTTTSAAGDILINAATGNAAAGSAFAKRDLKVTAPNGLASVGAGQAGRDFLLTGAQASLGSLGAYVDPSGYGAPLPTRDVTIMTTAGDFTFAGTLAGTRDVRVDIGGAGTLGLVTAGNDLFFRATGALALNGGGSTSGRDAAFDGASVQLAGFAATRDLTATARTGALTATGPLSAGDDAVLSGVAVTLASVTATGLGPDSDSSGPLLGSNVQITGATINATVISAARDALLRTTLGGLTLGGTVTAGRDISADAATTLTLSANLGATRDLILIGADVAAAGRSATAGRDLSVTARTGTLALGLGQAGDDTLLDGPTVLVDSLTATGLGPDSEGADPLLGSNVRVTGGAVTAGKLNAARDAEVVASGAADVGNGGGVIAGRDALLTGASLATGPINATRDAVLRTTASGLTVGNGITVGRDISADAAGTLTLSANLTGPRDVTLIGAGVAGSGRNVTAARDLTATARTGTLILGQVRAGDDAVLAGPSITVDTVTATGLGADSEGADPLLGSNVRITGGSLTVNGLSAARDVTVLVSGSATFPTGYGYGGSVSAGRDALLTAGDMSLPQVTATRDAVLRTTAAGLTLNGNVSAGRDLSVDAATTLTLAASLSATRDLLLIANSVFGAGRSATAGRDLTGTVRTGILALGAVQAGDDVLLAGPTVVAGAVNATGAGADSEGSDPLLGSNIQITGGSLDNASLTAARDVSVNVSGTANTGTVSAGRDALLTAGDLAAGGITATRDAILRTTAAGLTLGGTVSAGRDLNADAAGVLTISASLSAPRDLTLIGADVLGAGRSVTAGRDLTATARTGTLSLGAAQAGDDALLAGPTVIADSVRATGLGPDSESADPLLGSNIRITGGAATAATLNAARDVVVDVSGDASLGTGYGGSVGAGRDALLTGGSLSTGPVTAVRDIALKTTAANLTVGGNFNAGRDLSADAFQTLTISAPIGATRDLTLAGASVFGTGQPLTAGRDLTATARTATLALGSATAGDDIRLNGPNVSAGALTATGLGADSEPDGSNIVIVGGSVILSGNASAATDVRVTATGAAVIATGGTVMARDIVLSGGSLVAGSLTANRDLLLTATAGSFNATAGLSAARDLSVDASGNAALNGASAGRDLTLAGASVTTGAVSAVRDATLTGRSGGVAATASAGDDVRVSATGAVSGGYVTTGAGADTEADGSNVVLSGSNVGGSVFASNDLMVTATGAATVTGSGAGGLAAGRDARVVAATLSGPGFGAGRDLFATASGAVNTGVLFAVRDLSVTGAGITANTLSAGRDARIDAGVGTLDVVNANAGDDLTLLGATIIAENALASGLGADTEGDGSNIFATGGTVIVENGMATRDIRLTGSVYASLGLDEDGSLTGNGGTYLGDATQDIVINAPVVATGVLTARRDILLTATGGGVTAKGSLTATRDVSIAATGAAILLDLVQAGDDVRVAPTGALTAAAITTTGAGPDSEADGSNIVLGGSAITTAALSAAGDVSATTPGSLATSNIGAGRDVLLSGASLATGSLSAGRDLSLTATVVAIGGSGFSAVRDLTLDAAGALTLTGATSAGRNATLRGASVSTAAVTATTGGLLIEARSGNVGTGALAAGIDVMVNASGAAGNVSTGAITAGRDASLTATGGGMTLGDIGAGDDVRLSAALDISAGGLTATGAGADSEGDGFNVVVGGRAVTTGRLSAPGDVLVTATGAANLGSGAGYGYGTGVSAGRDAILRGATLATGPLSAGRDLSLTATGGSIAAGNLSAVRDLSVDASAALTAGTLGAGRDLRIAGASVGVGTATATRDVTVTALSGGLTIGSVSAGDDARLAGAANVTAGSVVATGLGADTEGDGSNVVIGGVRVTTNRLSAPGDVLVTATGAADIGSSSGGGVTAGRDARLTGATLVTGALSIGRDLALTATAGPLSAGNASAVRDLVLSASGALTAGTVGAGRDLNLNGASIATGAVTAVRDATLIASSGALGSGAVSAGDDARLSATADVTTGAVSATGLGGDSEGDGANVVINGAAVTTGRLVAANDVLVVATGAANLGPGAGGGVSAGRDARLTGATLASGPLTAGRDIALTTTAGALTVGNLDAVRDLILDASTALTAGNVTAGRDANLAGASVSAGSATAARDTTLIARSGTLNAGAVQAGDDARLTATGDVTTGAVSATGLGADTEGDLANVVINGTAITTGRLVAANDVMVTATGAAEIGAGAGGGVTAGRDVRLTGASLATGALVEGRDLALTATAGALTAGNLGAARDFTLDAGGALTAGAGTAGRDATLSGMSLASGGITAGRDATATARSGGLAAGAVMAGDDARLTATGTVTTGAVSATGAGTDTEGDLSNVVINGAAVSTGRLAAANDVTVTATGAANLGPGAGVGVSGGRDVRLTGATLASGPLAAGRDIALAATGGGLTVGDLAAVRDLTLDASAGLITGNASAGRDATLAGSSVTAGSATAARDATVTARSGGLTIGAVQAGDDARLTAALDLASGTVSATGLGTDTEADGSNVVINGRAVTTGRLTAASDVIVTATGAASLGLGAGGGVTAGRDVRLSAASLATGPLVQGRALSLTATGGAINAGNLTSVGDLLLDASGALTAGTVSSGRDLTLAGSSVTAGNVSAVRDVTATARAGGALALGAIAAGDDIRLTGGVVTLGNAATSGLGGDSEGDGANIVIGGASVSAGQVTAPGAISVTTTGALALAGAAAGGDLTVTGGSVGGNLASLTGNDIRLTATGTLADLTTLAARRDLIVSAANRIKYTDLSAGRDVMLTAPVILGGRAVAVRDLTVLATGSINGSLFQAGRNLVLDPDEPIIADTVIAGADATLIGSLIQIGLLQVGGRSDLSATAGGIALDTARLTGSAVMVATGKVSLGDATAGALAVRAGDLDVRRSLVAASLRAETPGPMTIGGAETGGQGFQLAAADIARMRVAGPVQFYAGTTGQVIAPTPRGGAAPANPVGAGGNLTLLDFTYDPAKLPGLAFYAGNKFAVDVQGRVATTATGGALQIGDPDTASVWRPGSIYISGAIGSAELVQNCYGKVVGIGSLSLYAVGDVIFGSSAFRTAIQGTPANAIDLANNVPNVPARTDEAIFAVAARFTVDAAGKVVSQNTAAIPGNYAGILVGSIASPGVAPLVRISRASVVDLSGSVILPNGDLRSGPNVAFIQGLNGGTVPGSFRFNGCTAGDPTSCGGGGSTPAEAFRIEDYQVPRPSDLTETPLVTILSVDTQPADLNVIVEGGGPDGEIVIRRKPTN